MRNRTLHVSVPFVFLSGHSQGGDMSTFAADKYPINRAINLSAPPQATVVNSVMTPASYFADFYNNTSTTNIRSVFGLVSQFDTANYNQTGGVYQTVWQAIGYNLPANNDVEWTLNVAGNLQALNCSGTPSNNFSTDAPVPLNGGHADTLNIWYEDIFEFMLIDN